MREEYTEKAVTKVKNSKKDHNACSIEEKLLNFKLDYLSFYVLLTILEEVVALKAI